MLSKFTPFFVADRPMSLKILSGLNVPSEQKIGIMAHANTSENFMNLLSKFPCVDMRDCDVIGGRCNCEGNIEKCPRGKILRNSVIKMSDSGAFQKKGCCFEYSELYEKYEKMGVEYGIIVDHLKDKDKTLESAKVAFDTYLDRYRTLAPFKLVAVAQGNDVEEYMECYESLKKMGFEHIAVGGMLQKLGDSARYVNVRDETLLRSVLYKIRNKYPEDWVFSLGSYCVSRHSFFLQTHMFGADYKGWIFQYKTLSSKRGDLFARERRINEVRKFIENSILLRSQLWRDGPRLMILPCSKTKNNDIYKGSAINVYNGPTYRIIRKYIPNYEIFDDDILIISAKYGLLNLSDKISPYDIKMTPELAKEMSAKIISDLKDIISEKKYSNVSVNLGKEYFMAIEPFIRCLNGTAVNVLSNLKSGERLSATKEWLLS